MKSERRGETFPLPLTVQEVDTHMFELTRWSPFGSLSTPFQLHREIDELFGRFFGQSQAPAPQEGNGGTPSWWPAVESWASEGNLHVRVALPGVDPKDVELSVTDDVLTIKGQRKRQSDTKDGGHFLREFSYGAFERALMLPEGVDPAGVTAKYANGMLEIAIPAPVNPVPKKVEIEIEGSQKSMPAAA
jgi:HSP20 family protein